MDITEHIEIGRSYEKVFAWMLQAQHIVQLITLDLTEGSMPDQTEFPQSYVGEQAERHRRWQEQAETVIGIEDLSTPTLRAGTTFRYTMGVKSRSEEFPPWRVFERGSITMQKISPFRLFSFRVAGNGIMSSFDCQLTFQSQGKNTRITCYRSYRFIGKALRMGVRALLSPLLGDTLRKFSFDRYHQVVMQHQLQQLKVHMEDEIDQEEKE